MGKYPKIIPLTPYLEHYKISFVFVSSIYQNDTGVAQKMTLIRATSASV